MLWVTCASLKEGCICLAAEFKYQQAFSSITDYTFKVSKVLIMQNGYFNSYIIIIEYYIIQFLSLTNTCKHILML